MLREADERGRIVRPQGAALDAKDRADWTVLEAVAWIGSRDYQLVSGVGVYGSWSGEPAPSRSALQDDLQMHFLEAGILAGDAATRLASTEQKWLRQRGRRRRALILGRRISWQSDRARLAELRHTALSPSPSECFDICADALRRAGEQGAIVARGAPPGGVMGEVPCSAWKGARLEEMPTISGFDGVLVPHRDLMRLWPARSAEALGDGLSVRRSAHDPSSPRRRPKDVPEWAAQMVADGKNQGQALESICERWPTPNLRPSRDEAVEAFNNAAAKAGKPVRRGRPSKAAI